MFGPVAFTVGLVQYGGGATTVLGSRCAAFQHDLPGPVVSPWSGMVSAPAVEPVVVITAAAEGVGSTTNTTFSRSAGRVPSGRAGEALVPRHEEWRSTRYWGALRGSAPHTQPASRLWQLGTVAGVRWSMSMRTGRSTVNSPPRGSPGWRPSIEVISNRSGSPMRWGHGGGGLRCRTRPVGRYTTLPKASDWAMAA